MSLNLTLRLKSRLCRPHEIRGMKQRELAIRIDEMRNTECKPCVNTQLNRLVENTQRQQHDGTHKAKYDCIIPFPLLLHQRSPFCTLQRPPSQPKKTSDSWCKSSSVAMMEFKIKWWIPYNSKPPGLFTGYFGILPVDFRRWISSCPPDKYSSHPVWLKTNSSSSKMSSIPFETIPFQKQHPYPTRWFTEWQ